MGALLVGVAEAKAIAYGAKKPLVGVHHIEGHVSANFIEHLDLEPPFVCLIVSGGHTHLVIVRDYGEFEIIGRTMDDAAGEAFDKVARAVGLGYPGGPKVDRAAKEGNPHAIEFPRARVGGSEYDFSFSGMKSAVLNYINQAQMKGEAISVPDLCASFQNAVVEALVSRAILAAKEYGLKDVAIAGGVASNGSGDFVIAFSTNEKMRVPYDSKPLETLNQTIRSYKGEKLETWDSYVTSTESKTEGNRINAILVSNYFINYSESTWYQWRWTPAFVRAFYQF